MQHPPKGVLMKFVPLETAMLLTDRSERTLWRMMSDGLMLKKVLNGRVVLSLDSLKPHFCTPFSDEDYKLLDSAIDGDAASQTDVALIFMSKGKSRLAIYWLSLAVQQNFPDAMSILGRCYIEGDGVDKDEKTGIVWLTKAAALGHAISKAQAKELGYFL